MSVCWCGSDKEPVQIIADAIDPKFNQGQQLAKLVLQWAEPCVLCLIRDMVVQRLDHMEHNVHLYLPENFSVWALLDAWKIHLPERATKRCVPFGISMPVSLWWEGHTLRVEPRRFSMLYGGLSIAGTPDPAYTFGPRMLEIERNARHHVVIGDATGTTFECTEYVYCVHCNKKRSL